jgi:hypothetical protein
MKIQARTFCYLLLGAFILTLGITAFLALRLPVKFQAGESATLTILATKPDTSATSPSLATAPTGTNPTPNIDLQATDQALILRSQSVCAQIWGSALPSNLPDWLTTPSNAEDLYTDVKYVYLAGELITHGYVNAEDCPDNGLTPSGVSNVCGMEKAFPEVVAWQNQFDLEIFTAAEQNLVPANLIKRLFAQETQFWPNIDFAPPSYGLGNVTSPGIEPLFMWYADIYQHTCIDLFSKSCSRPYSSLDLADRQNLRGFFISRHIHAYCPSCAHGIDLEKTKSSIDFFTKLIVANCQQVNLLLTNLGFLPKTLTYEDTWRLTLTNYTVGTGCVETSLGKMDPSKHFSWVSFTDIIDNDCKLNVSVNTFINNTTK